MKRLLTFSLILVVFFAIDQGIKYLVIYLASPDDISSLDLHGFYMIADMPVISIALVFNTGVAFSFFTSFGEWLKYIQILLIFVIIGVLYSQRDFFNRHYIPFGIMLGSGLSNVLDRFLHGGVVDYIYWHYQFDFPIFNFADMMIDCGIAIFIWQVFFAKSSKRDFKNPL